MYCCVLWWLEAWCVMPSTTRGSFFIVHAASFPLMHLSLSQGNWQCGSRMSGRDLKVFVLTNKMLGSQLFLTGDGFVFIGNDERAYWVAGDDQKGKHVDAIAAKRVLLSGEGVQPEADALCDAEYPERRLPVASPPLGDVAMPLGSVPVHRNCEYHEKLLSVASSPLEDAAATPLSLNAHRDRDLEHEGAALPLSESPAAGGRMGAPRPRLRKQDRRRGGGQDAGHVTSVSLI